MGQRCFLYRWTWIWQTQWDQENWSIICKIRHIHMTNTWYASNWDQAYPPSYAKIRHTVIHHIQVHLYLHTYTKFRKGNIKYLTFIPYNRTLRSVQVKVLECRRSALEHIILIVTNGLQNLYQLAPWYMSHISNGDPYWSVDNTLKWWSSNI